MRLALLIPLALAPACSGGSDARPVPDHVLLIVVDTLRADHLGCYGHSSADTPALDWLAAGGVRFAQAYAQGSFTAPSMVSLFTGRRLSEERLDLPADLPTLAESFRDGGWATAGFVMNDIVNADTGFGRGFGPFEQMTPYSDNGPIVAWLGAQVGERTFTYVHLNEPHDPYLPPEAWREQLLDPPAVSDELHAYFRGVHDDLGLQGDFEEAVRHIEHERAGYVDDVGYTDERIAGLLEVLERTGLAERTCVIVTSDHGEGLWTRVALMNGQRGNALRAGQPATLVNTLMPTHGSQVNRELSHVPLIIRSPALPAGRVVEGPVELIDVFPTLLELCDLPLPTALPGNSLLARIEAGRSRGLAFTHTRFNSSLIAPDGWQLILPTPRGECEEGLEVALYDLNTDPEARVNLAAQHPERVAELAAEVGRRLQAGVWGTTDEIPGSVLEAIARMGYGSSGVVDEARTELLEMPIAELVDLACTDKTCVVRFEAARALAQRKDELSEELRETLRTRLDVEASPAVRTAIEEL